ncbi:transposase [Microbispora hainanensis]|uniref:Transposase n=1 Tax=Microbispora hainanensis TaxID=568844 RepID=A0ABZ1SM98_9ACTN|nr:transposase [Microbispora hainanensis]
MSPRRYPSDLTDAQWEQIQPLLPAPNMDGRPEKHPRREIVNAILYLVRSGCPWRYLPTDLPPWQTVYWHFQRWEQAGILATLLSELGFKARPQTLLDADDASTARDDVAKKKGRKRLIPDITRPLVALSVMATSLRKCDYVEQVMLLVS